MSDTVVRQGVFAGRYTIQEEVGRGATATVYGAFDERLGRRVALKILRPELGQSSALRHFEREAERMRGLQHDRILPVLDAGEWEGKVYFALPFMEGGTLRQRLQRDKQLPIGEAVAIARTIAEALDHAHARHLIHRDIKPENILFSEGQAFLADFGIARAVETALDTGESTTTTGIVKGTPAYMSPEQASGARDYDGRSDLFALGCVLYEMLAGVHAFIGPTPQAVLAQRFTHRPRDVRVYRENVSEELHAILMKATEPSPADRFASAGDFARALARASLTRPTTLHGRFRSWLAAAPRTRPAALAVSVVAVAIAATLITTALRRTPASPRLAVLYFDARQPDTTLRRVADAITEDLIYDLGGVGALQVVPRQFVLPFRASAAPMDSVIRALGATMLVTGAVSRAGDALRIQVHVVDARTRTYLDSLSTLQSLADVNTRDVAGIIATTIRTRMGRDARLRRALEGVPTDTARALVRRAMGEWADGDVLARKSHPDDKRVALESFARADTLLALAAADSRGWANPVIERVWLALALQELLPDSARTAALRKALSLAESALRIEHSARAMEARGAAHWAFVTNFGDTAHIAPAAADLRAAVERDSTLPQAWQLLSEYYWEREGPAAASLAAQRALNLDTWLAWRPRVYTQLFYNALIDGNMAQAEEWCRRARITAPDDWRLVQCELIRMQQDDQARPDTARAWQVVRLLDRLDPPEVARAAGRPYWPIHRRVLAATVAARAGDQARARTELAWARRTAGTDSSVLLDLAPDEAILRWLLGDRERALALYRTALRERPFEAPVLRRAAVFRELSSALSP